MTERRKKRSWKVAPVTSRTLGQRQTNELLREMFGQECTAADLEKFQGKHGFYPFYIRKDKNYRIVKGRYRVPGPQEPLSPFGPKGEGATVLHKTSPDAESVSVRAVAERDAAERDEDDASAAMTTVDSGTAATQGFRDNANLTAGDIQRRLEQLQAETSNLAVVPQKNKAFVPFGDYELVSQIVKSRKFFTTFVTGESGIGKTLFWKQACAEHGREFIRVNITAETDEDDLLGGFRLRGGETVFELGPAVIAMIRGAVLLLDEIDLASPKIMCLQPILEGEPITLKKLGVTIAPAPGFNVVATANTKGRGDDAGKFIGTGLLNEAFLERFAVTVEQQYPPAVAEEEILRKTFVQAGGTLHATAKTFINTLAKWAANVREAYQANACDDTLSTRRLCHIVRAFHLFGENDPQSTGRAVNYCLKRYDANTREQLKDLWNKHTPQNTPSNVGGASAPSGF